MSIFIDPTQSLLDLINVANGTTVFTSDNVQFSAPVPVVGTWFEGVTDKNTVAKVSAKDGASFKGKTYVKYDRLQLGDFIHFRPTRSLPCMNPSTVGDILKNILYYYSIYLTIDDVIDDPIALDETGSGTVTVRAKDTSLKWLGSVTFDIVQGGAFVTDYLTTTSLNGLNYPVDDYTTETSALLYFFPLDFTSFRDQLLIIGTGALSGTDAQTLADATKLLDLGLGATHWSADTEATSWSFGGATVVYNGLNSSAYTSNQNYKYILVLQFAPTVLTPTGQCILHYNDPEDPNSIS